MKSALLRRASVGALALGLGLLLTLAALLQSPDNQVARSVASSEPEGWRALFLLFEDLELASEVWTGDPVDLPDGRHALWWGNAPDLVAAPQDVAGRDESAPADAATATEAAPGNVARAPDALDRARADGPRAPRHLRRFLAQGGRLVAPPLEPLRDWLEREAGLHELEGAAFEAANAADGPARTAGGEHLELELGEAQRLVGLDPQLACEVLLRDAAGAALVVEVPIGRGAVVFLPDASLFDNADLDAGQAGLFAVRLAEWFAPGGRQLFDEGALGLGSAPGLGSILWGADLRLASLHVLLLALLGLWASSWPREFARDPVRHDHVAPLERARAAAGLALRARRVGVLAQPLRRAALERAGRRLRVELPAEVELLAGLAALEAARDARFDAPRWRRALTAAAPANPAALAELDTELRALEAQLCDPEGARRAHSFQTTPASSA